MASFSGRRQVHGGYRHLHRTVEIRKMAMAGGAPSSDETMVLLYNALKSFDCMLGKFARQFNFQPIRIDLR